METAKVVGGNGVPSPIPSGDDVDALLDLNDSVTQQAPQQIVEERQLLREKTSNRSETTDQSGLRRKPLSKILRIARPKPEAEQAGSPTNSSTPKRRVMRFRFPASPKKSSEQTSPQQRNASKRSPQSRPRTFKDGRLSRERRTVRRIPRSTSSQEGFPRMDSLKRLSLPRSSSERQYRTDVLQATRMPPRSNSRRWRDDDFGIPEQREEGELDSFFRFMEECTQAVWTVLKEIPIFISRLPEITMETLKRLIPALRGPTVPLLEGPRDEVVTP